jgi:hypothetical protein
MSGLAEVSDQRDALIEAALKVVLFGLAIAHDDTALVATLKAEREMAFTARDLTAAIDDLPLERQLRGWRR